MKNSIYLVVLLLLVSGFALAQTEKIGSASGRVTDKLSGQPIAGVTVSAGTRETITDVEGNFRLELPAGEYNLRFKADEAEAEAFWAVAKGNITILDDLGQWWTLFRDGAEPVVDEADRDFVRQALALLPPQPWTTATWGEWTAAVKDATGRKGKDLFRPLRRALTGRDAGPEMADVMPLLRRVPSV